MARYATIDIGTNSVLLLVAEQDGPGRFKAVAERAEITRLGRGVDQARALSTAGMDETLRVLRSFADEAHRLGAQAIAVSATSAARDATNGAEFLRRARDEAGLDVEIISGDLEAQLSYRAAAADFGAEGPLVVIDIGGGSTEFIYGSGHAVRFRHSFDVGSVRLTERHVRSDPPSTPERAAIERELREAFSTLPPPDPGARLVGVAGTVTTLYAVQHAVAPYDAERIQGGTLRADEVRMLADRLFALPLAQRRSLPGIQPKRADVICAGALILAAALDRLKATACTVSDRGLRWGLLVHRFGALQP